MRAAGLAGIILAIGLSHELLPEPGQWQYLLSRLYYLPVVLAAIYDGWRGGVLLAALATAAMFFRVPTSPMM